MRHFTNMKGIVFLLCAGSIFVRPATANIQSYLNFDLTNKALAVDGIQASSDDLDGSTGRLRAVKTLKVWVTAYSSTPEQTDDTPFTTASGKQVRDGIIATNFLPFGTLVKIPKLFGDKVFVVEDRMHERKKNFVDVWMSETEEAMKLGIQNTEIVVLFQPEVLVASASNGTN